MAVQMNEGTHFTERLTEERVKFAAKNDEQNRDKSSSEGENVTALAN